MEYSCDVIPLERKLGPYYSNKKLQILKSYLRIFLKAVCFSDKQNRSTLLPTSVNASAISESIVKLSSYKRKVLTREQKH